MSRLTSPTPTPVSVRVHQFTSPNKSIFTKRGPLLRWQTPSRIIVYGSVVSGGESRDEGVTRTSRSDSVSTSSKDLPSNETLLKFMSSLYAFTRPHTMMGTLIGILSVSYLAIQSLPFSKTMLQALGWAVSSSLLMNIFIVGLNQIYDVNIDRINKPYLPLAAGDFTMSTANAICGVSLILSLVIGWMSKSPPLMATLVLSMVLGIAYSADFKFLRWKRNAFVAATCILVVRALAVQLGFYLHMKYSLGTEVFQLSKSVVYTLMLFCYYSIVIAMFKDIPDFKGDLKVNHKLHVLVGIG
eukprot:g6841.t1